MKVKTTARRPKVIEVNASFGARLIEQGKAVLAAETPKTGKKADKNP